MDLNNMDDIRAYFAKDEFARKCLGATIDDYDFETGVATVSMEIDDRHHNAQGFVMGGVFFSLADYALAVASNVNQPPSASTNASIAHMRRVKGNKLKAVAYPDKLGRNLAFFTVDLIDEPGNLVARMSATVMRTDH
ncbi:MAG: PaaI family thioesterase [Coriobacteriales bacterium]